MQVLRLRSHAMVLPMLLLALSRSIGPSRHLLRNYFACTAFVYAPRFVPSPTRLCLSSDDSQGKTLAPGLHVLESEVKKSRFVAYAAHVKSWEDALRRLNEIKADHPKARHWCYGFRCGSNPTTERCSDDGEPTGTAGLPILGAMKSEGLSDVLCVVVRYFGGIKLGAGGLIRAYGAATRLVLRQAPIQLFIPQSVICVTVDSQLVGILYDVVGKVGGHTIHENYTHDGKVTVQISCDSIAITGLQTALKDATRGKGSDNALNKL